jgi:hypothetical protein
MSRGAATHRYARAMKLIGDSGPMNAQLRTDLAQGPTLGVRVGHTLTVHGATVTTVARPA